MTPSKVILNITPQTNVRATQGDRVFFRIPRDKLLPGGLKRLKRLERYNDYKLSLLALAKEKGFVISPQGCSFRFYIPMPKTWSKKKRALMHGKLHMQKPDIDNLMKAVFDSMMSEDKGIAHFEAVKFWVDFPAGWIEIATCDPVFPTIPSK
jgi:Holliday junction resolvase RusA-like endonuclease